MKQRRFPLSILVLLLLSIAIILWKSPRSARMAAIDKSPEAPAAPAETRDGAPAPVPPVAYRKAAKIADEVTDLPDIQEIAALVESVNPMKASDLQEAVASLRSYPPPEVTAYFIKSLKEIGSQRPHERDRLIMVANSLQSKTDLPFWVDLVKRETPRYADEEKLRNPQHPTLESRFVDMEQLQAIRNIGLLARDNREARRVLMEVILTPNPSMHRTLHREEAYLTLKEADLAASLRVLKQLAAEDDLLKRL
ncbi:MAG TPA: hypothetical protein VFO10_26190 [Oligoflexus sp.]|uniref:hypothetical protein n=1 Tax=Oligoflexus sp. TaxID=1971216 RepID=UPI002D80F5F3|nr:hypothetical protein [Oligoflexus sp.]HET9240782.1 hypothetical protein [Oligoflexus sp.]